MAEIDTLQVKITANAKSAADSLKSLASALGKVKTSLSGLKSGFDAADRLEKIANGISKSTSRIEKSSDGVTKSFEAMNRALDGISIGGLAKLEELTKTLKSYAEAAKAVKALGNVNISSKIKAVTGAGSRSKSSGGKEYDYTEKDFQSVGMSLKNTMVVTQNVSEKIEQTAKAVKNLDQESEKASKSVKKVGDETKKAGEKAKKATKGVSGFMQSISRILMYRAIRTALKEIGEAFNEGLKNAYAFSKTNEDFTRLASTLDFVKSLTSQMTNQLGAMWGELKQFILPAVQWLVEQIRYMAEKLTEVFAALNGQKTYLWARYQEQAWDDAIGKAKEYKHQLLGLDELNNLSKQKSSTKDEEQDYSKLYDIIQVSPEWQQIGAAWQDLKLQIATVFDEIRQTCLGEIGMLALGTILLFTTHKLLGLGLIIGSGLLIAEKYDFNWDDIYKDIKKTFKKYRKLITAVSLGMMAIGTILLFVPSKKFVGLSMIIESGLLMAANVAFNWDEMYSDIKKCFKKYKKLIIGIAVGMAAIGTILLFIPSMKPVGISMIISSGVLLAADVAFNWDELYKSIKRAFKKYKKLFAATAAASIALGAILMFVPGFETVGITMLLTAGVLGAATVALNWDELLDWLQKAWQKVCDWWDDTVVVGIRKAFGWIEEQFKIDINGDGILGYVEDKLPSNKKYESSLAGSIRQGYIQLQPEIFGAEHPGLSNIPIGGGTNVSSQLNTNTLNGINTDVLPSSDLVIIKPGSAADVIDSSLKEASSVVKRSTPSQKSISTHTGSTTSSAIGISGLAESVRNGSIQLEPYIFGAEHPDLIIKKKASGGIVNGSLFWAGESGAEFVGNIGSTSAVANTGQMTDAIYKAAYMGMSKALKENGGNGMGGYEPATMDDLFIAMRKKASKYNRMTGNPAFN